MQIERDIATMGRPSSNLN